MLTFAIFAQGQINYNNRSFLKDVDNFCQGSKLSELSKKSNLFNGKFFKISGNESVKGFAYVGRVNSCRSNGCSIASNKDEGFEYFDYYAIFDTSKKIAKISVFNYQATHGQEVTAKSWLKQFLGYNGTKKLVVGKNIDGISGATISTNALTTNIQEVMKQLQQY